MTIIVVYPTRYNDHRERRIEAYVREASGDHRLFCTHGSSPGDPSYVGTPERSLLFEERAELYAIACRAGEATADEGRAKVEQMWEDR